MTTNATNELTTFAAPGGFTGDPAEAFTPPAAGGCCGSTPATTDAGTPAATDSGAAGQPGPAAPASTCCGSAEAAQSAGACCDPVAKTEAVAAGAGCCG